MPLPGAQIDEYNTVFRNPGPGTDKKSGKWIPLTEEAGLDAVPAAARHRGCAFGDLDGDGHVADVVATALQRRRRRYG